MRASFNLVALSTLLATSTCTPIQVAGIQIPPGVIDCGVTEVTKLAIELITDVNTCLGEGKSEFCNAEKPVNPTETKCTWKACLWNLAKKQGQQRSVDALLCAVDQSGVDFRETGMASKDNTAMESTLRAEDFVKESGARLKHREIGATFPAGILKKKDK
jgi:hypothetical protein